MREVSGVIIALITVNLAAHKRVVGAALVLRRALDGLDQVDPPHAGIVASTRRAHVKVQRLEEEDGAADIEGKAKRKVRRYHGEGRLGLSLRRP